MKQKLKINKQSDPVKPSSIKQALLGLYGIVGITLSMFGGFKVPFAEANAKDYWRHALAGIILIVALIAGIVSFAIYIFNANYFKSQIVDYVKTNNQRDLTLDGDLTVTFFPTLGLDTGKMTLSQRNSSKGFASIESGHFHIAWWPLFLKQLQIESIALNGVHANVVRYKDGSTNLDDFFSADGNLGDIKFEIDSIKFLNSSINLEDESVGYFLSLHDLNLETGKLADATPGDISANFRLESTKPRIDTKVKFSSHLLFDLKTRKYELSNLDGEMEGETAGINSLALSFQGSIHGDTAAAQLTVDKFVASGKGKYDNRNLDAKLDIPKLEIQRRHLKGATLAVNATLMQDDESLTTSIEMPAFEMSDKKFSSENFSANFNLFKSGRTLQGKLVSPLNVDFETKKISLPTVASNISGTHPALSSKLTVSLAGDLVLDLDEQNARLNLKATIGDSHVDGNLGMQNFSQPAYSFDLGVDTLDLDRYLATDWSKRLQDDAMPFDLSDLKNMSLHGKFRSNTFKLARLNMNNLHAEIKAEQSTLLIDVVGARLYGGSATGSLAIVASDKAKISLKQKLNGVQINSLITDFRSGEAKLTGKGNINLDLNGSGENMGALRKTLNGNASLALGRGSISGINLADTLIEEKNQLGVQEAKHAEVAKFTESTAFSELKSTFEIADGKASTRDFLMKSPLFTSKGEGEIELQDGQLAFRLNTTVAPGLKRSSNGEIAELKGVAIPVQISGPYATPTITLDFAAASGGNIAKSGKASSTRISTPTPAFTKSKTKPTLKKTQ